MSYFYSKSRNRFYYITDEQKPTDIVEIEASRGSLFYIAQAKGDAAELKGGSRAGYIVSPEAIQNALVVAATEDEKLIMARRLRRDQLLQGSDWSQLPDTFVGDAAKKEQWAEYRQALRDKDFTDDVWAETP